MTNEEVEIIKMVFQSYLNIVKIFKKPNYISEEVITEVRDKLIKELEQEPVLDKIRAEIERERSFQRTMDEYDIATGLRTALDIIDKYKAESE